MLAMFSATRAHAAQNPQLSVNVTLIRHNVSDIDGAPLGNSRAGESLLDWKLRVRRGTRCTPQDVLDHAFGVVYVIEANPTIIALCRIVSAIS